MKSFLHKCPLVVLTVLISLAVACSVGVQRVLAMSEPINRAGTSASSTPAPSSSDVPVSSVSPQESSAVPVSSSLPQPSSASSAKAVSSARSKSVKPPKKKIVFAPQIGQPVFCAVKRNYYDDALFVGDSLTEDLKKYSGLDNASYFYHVGLNIYQLFETPKTCAITGLTFDRTLRAHQYKKIYVMLGINEMGTGDTAYFVRHYSSALKKIRELQPDAILYIESILPVTAEKSEADSTFNNPNIRERDAGLQKLANGKNIFYLDVASALEDESGNLPQEYSGDDVHLKAKYYPLWTNFLLKNAVPYENAVFS